MKLKCLHPLIKIVNGRYRCLACKNSLAEHYKIFHDQYDKSIIWISKISKKYSPEWACKIVEITPIPKPHKPQTCRKVIYPDFIKISNEESKRIRIESIQKKNELIAIRGQQCQKCERRTYLYLHHIKPVVIGGDNSNENLILLCSDCHKIEDELSIKNNGGTVIIVPVEKKVIV